MTDTNEPTVPGTPPAAPPPPTGQPIGSGDPAQPVSPHPGPPQPGYAVAPAPARSTGKFVAGIILTVVGGLWALGALANIAIAARAFADNPGYAAGRVVGGILLPLALLIVGIVLIRASKPKV